MEEFLNNLYSEQTKEASNEDEILNLLECDDLLKIASGEITLDQAIDKLSESTPKKKEQSEPMEKKASQKLSFADGLARQLAHTHSEVLQEKRAGFREGFGIGKALRNTKIVAKAAKESSPETAREALKWVKSVREQNFPELSTSERVGAHFGEHGKKYLAGAAGAGGIYAGKKIGERKEKISACMTKHDAFTTPEAQAKAKVVQRAMKATKGAPPSVRKGALKVVGKQI
jgi:hypothetical protein